MKCPRREENPGVMNMVFPVESRQDDLSAHCSTVLRGEAVMIADPRKCATLGEAARNPDGTWNAFRALSWISISFDPEGKGHSVEEVEAMYQNAKKGIRHEKLDT